jgi:nicotinate phosphoribosyltransferase
MQGDTLTLADHVKAGEPLIHEVMRSGRRTRPKPSLDDIRRHAKRELETLPQPLRQLTPGASYPVDVADDLIKLAAEVDARVQR